jgi:hypothetical protein
LCSLNRFFTEDTLARQFKNKQVSFWYCARLIVSLHSQNKQQQKIYEEEPKDSHTLRAGRMGAQER